MHPNAFLKTHWRMELKSQVFVAMSFARQYDDRFTKVLAPAIQRLSVGGHPLQPSRVDLSCTGSLPAHGLSGSPCASTRFC